VSSVDAVRGRDYLGCVVKQLGSNHVDWIRYFEVWSGIVRDEARIRATRAGLQELTRCCARQIEVLGRAASQLRRSGVAADWVEGALLADIDSPRNTFALLVLGRMNPFPHRFIRPLVQAGVRAGEHSSIEQAISAASLAYGREPILELLLEAARVGLPYEQAMRLLCPPDLLSMSRGARPAKRPAVEYDLEAEIIQISSGGKIRWLRTGLVIE
jgi:hypothetical protein